MQSPNRLPFGITRSSSLLFFSASFVASISRIAFISSRRSFALRSFDVAAFLVFGPSEPTCALRGSSATRRNPPKIAPTSGHKIKAADLVAHLWERETLHDP